MKNYFFILSIFIGFASCGEDETEKLRDEEVLRQYADEVLGFSTEYNPSPGAWSAYQLLGKENVYPLYGDVNSAWTQLGEGRQFLVVGFDTTQTVSAIEIYETYFPGAVDTVYVRNSSTQEWKVVYAGTPSNLHQEGAARIFTITIPETSYYVDAVRIAIDSEFYLNLYTNREFNQYPYIEIDAVAITGRMQE